MKQYATYLRVSTQKQGASGLGLDAQRKMCNDYIESKGGGFIEEFKDVESGTHRDRKGLWDAIEYCRKNHCPLIVAKLDRLARDVEFCFKVINTGIEIHFVDMPQINTLLLGVFASVAQYERELTSDRTKKALAAKKQRGEKTGGASDKWQESYNNKTKDKIFEESMKRGNSKNRRHLESRDIQVFIKVLKNVFPDATADENMNNWLWKDINTKDGNRQRVLSLMRDYKDIEPTLFPKWDLTNIDGKDMQVKLATYINSLRHSIKTSTTHENEE